MQFAKPHFQLTSLIYFPVFLLSLYLVLFQPYWILKSISIVCFIWLICLALLAFSKLGDKNIGIQTEQTIETQQNSPFFRMMCFQALTFITLIGGLFAIHSFISPQIIIYPKTYAFTLFFSWVIYLLSAAAFACFTDNDNKFSFVNQCLSPLFKLNFFKKHATTIKVINNTYFLQASFIWLASTFAILLFAITQFSSLLFHAHLLSGFTISNILIASILFLILSNKLWSQFIREYAYDKQFLVLFLIISIFLIASTNLLSWSFYFINNFFHFSSIRISFSIQQWLHWIDSTVLNRVFIWFWLFGFTPFVALKTVKICRGFTIKKMIAYNLILPSIVSALLFSLSSFTMLATTLPKQVLMLSLFILSLGLIIYSFVVEQPFQKLFFSRVTVENDERHQNAIKATRGIFQNIVMLFILILLFGLLILSIILPVMFFPVWLLTILLCFAIIYAIKQSQLSN